MGGMVLGRFLAQYGELAQRRVAGVAFVATSAAPASLGPIRGGLGGAIRVLGPLSDLIERFPEAIVGMQAWMGDDALGRLVLTAYPCLVGERTAAMTEQMLSRTDLTPGVRRALIDIGHRHEEAMRSLHRYAATQR